MILIAGDCVLYRKTQSTERNLAIKFICLIAEIVCRIKSCEGRKTFNLIFGYDVHTYRKTSFVRGGTLGKGGWIPPEKCLYRLNMGFGMNELLLIGFVGAGLPPLFDVVETEYKKRIEMLTNQNKRQVNKC